MSGGPALGDFTTIDQSAHARQGLLRDGSGSIATLMDPALAHPVLASLPTSDTQLMWLINPLGVGSPAVCCVAKQIDYDVNRAANGMLTMKTKFESDGFGIEMNGLALTNGVRSDTTATDGTAYDQGQGFATPGVPASTAPVTNTSPLPATVTVSGGTVSNVSVNGVTVGSGDGTYTVPAGQAITLTYSSAPTWTWLLGTAWGAQAYLQVTAFTGTSVTAKVQHSADNSTWLDLAAFTAVTAAPAFQRVTATAAQSFTATDASPAVFTVPGSAPANGTPVALSGSSLPGGFTAGAVYYVVSSSGSTFELALTSGGTALNSSSTGSGTVTPAVLRYLRAISTGTFSAASFGCAAMVNITSTAF